MKKKIVLLFTGCMLAMCLGACGGKAEETTSTEPIIESFAEPTTESETIENMESNTEETVETEAVEEVEYTEEQLAFIDDFNFMIENFHMALDDLKASPDADKPEVIALIKGGDH